MDNVRRRLQRIYAESEPTSSAILEGAKRSSAFPQYCLGKVDCRLKQAFDNTVEYDFLKSDTKRRDKTSDTGLSSG